ncbi:bifunctional aspartate kinase/homoserine dehydrogenase I [Pontibacter sp. SGAir0037]|uniref:bifunctional aspartate kinase/homoserine dehydrogenase I n=1 Tax=Pontibacter sp. SGAir0037 TaxID=2571030 RepID=UPI0010CD178C|nr:bifunctional aspartate kinase/homoserine dehydrogenase I [Pontibacter sp. SGAir0037]QCR21810.1 bifunctional aspartate kinase/homoserine dehydrogenase I [Pontibacter sp. SGAir0037]
MKVLKFGGKSLGNGEPIKSAVEIIKKEKDANAIALVVSARGQSTDLLLELYRKAVAGEAFEEDLEKFFGYQRVADLSLELDTFYAELKSLLQAMQLLGIVNDRIRDRVVAFGEVISAITVAELLRKEGIEAVFADARQLLVASCHLNDVAVDFERSREKTNQFFSTLQAEQVPVITGFIASDPEGNTITLGRNGSNYTATLIASFIKATEVQNWTDIDGVYTASPKYVKNAQKIPHLSYREANELANFGARVLHAKTILPLVESGIPLKIYSSFAYGREGTLIDEQGSGKGIKAVSTIEDVSLVSIEGRGLLGKVGIDARIFSALSRNNISVRLISQASSERGIGFIINKEDAVLTEQVLQAEFKEELQLKDISRIQINNEMAIIAIVGRHNYSLEKAIYGLRRNKIWMHLISNSINGEHISLVVDNKSLKKAVNVVHNQVFGAIKTLNLFAFGKGNVGGRLLDQIIETGDDVIKRRNLQINIVGVADSKKMVFNEDGFTGNWREKLVQSEHANDFRSIMQLLKESGLENIVIADNTSSQDLTERYPEIVNSGFDIVASNKKANSISYSFYENLRNDLKRRGKLFFYETNVGAGLPLIDTIKHLHNSSDKITRIRGVFSGSLSYIFNNYSVTDKSFSTILSEARMKGYTEPDPREDLSGLDVARKLIILAREVGLKTELEDVAVENLVPGTLAGIGAYEEFIAESNTLDTYFGEIKAALKEDEVLRYVGDLDVNENKLTVSLVKASKNSPLGNIRNADSLFEIYTEGYATQPIIIQGAGAGAEVTARGVYSDLLRIGGHY